MRLLSRAARPFVVGCCLLAVAVGTLPAASAHPPAAPDHGVDAETFPALWSGDVDDGEADELESPAVGTRALAAATDVPFDAPPAAVERWNRGDHLDFPGGGRTTAVHPPGTDLRSGAYVRDAGVAIFAVQPSTRAHVAPGDEPQYVAPTGEVLGTVDYRVRVPDDVREANRTVDWRLRSHGIDRTRLLADGRVVASGPGTHTPRLRYALPPDDGAVTLALEATVTARLEATIRTCAAHRNNSTACLAWDVDRERRTERLVVRTSVRVVPYDLRVSGAMARYPDGDLGVVVYKNRPWLGYAVPGGEVRGVWRFYAARDARWDALVEHTADGSRRRHAPLHPLVVHAFPHEVGPTAVPADRVSLLETYGLETAPPALPRHVDLDVVEAPYERTLGLATRSDLPAGTADGIVARGLVRGVAAELGPGDLETVPVHRTELTLEVVDATPDTVTVRATLRDAETGAPVATLGREGRLLLEGERVETDRSGTVTRTVPRPAGAVTARFEPGPWWLADVGYTGSSATVYVRGTVLGLVAIAYQLGVPVGLLLAGIFVLDRLTGWGVWPPWRGL